MGKARAELVEGIFTVCACIGEHHRAQINELVHQAGSCLDERKGMNADSKDLNPKRKDQQPQRHPLGETGFHGP